MADGTIERTGDGKRGDPYHYRVFCTLVPPISPGQENEKAETGQLPRQSSLFSRSHDLTNLQNDGDKKSAAREVIEL